MAMDQSERDKRRREKAAKVKEEDLRLKVRPGTKQALLELMQWSQIEEQGEALTLMIHHLHGLGPNRAVLFLTPPRHEYRISKAVAQKIERFNSLEALRVCRDS